MSTKEKLHTRIAAIIKKTAAVVYRVYPLTGFGTLVFICSVSLFIHSFYSMNPAGFILSVSAFMLLLVLFVLGKVSAVVHDAVINEWDSKAPLIARVWNMPQFIFTHKPETIPFFRIFFQLTGKTIVGRKSRIFIREEQALEFDKTGRAVFPLYQPVSGTMNVDGLFSIRDIFGLTNNVFGKTENRIIPVLPASASSKKIQEIITAQGFEDSVKKKSQDMERYFMREYIPGDRLRDINWQASMRFQKLITKIAPVTQEQAKSLVIYFRNIKENGTESLESIMHLDRIKSHLVSFINQTKESYPEYVFHVFTATDKFELNGDDDIDRFSRDLASMWYVNTHDQSIINPNIGDFFVFSTFFDTHLGSFISLFPKSRKTIIQTWRAAPGMKAADSFKFFSPFRASLMPGKFILNKEPKFKPQLINSSESIEIEREFLDIRLT